MAKEGTLVKAPRQRDDDDWQERIERAKSAREEGRKAREGKPVTFPMRRASI